MNCKKCGEAIAEDAVFCPKCGQKQIEEPTTTGEEKRNTKKPKTADTTSGCVMGIQFIMGIILVVVSFSALLSTCS